MNAIITAKNTLLDAQRYHGRNVHKVTNIRFALLVFVEMEEEKQQSIDEVIRLTNILRQLIK